MGMVEARLDELVGKGSARPETKVELSLPPVGVANRHGAPVPDISRFWREQGRSPTRTAQVACGAADIGFQEVAEILPVKGAGGRGPDEAAARDQHRLPDRDVDAMFTRDRPVIVAHHGHSWLIHRLCYRRTNHDNMHVRGYVEEGTTTTPFDMTVLNRRARVQGLAHGISRQPGGSALVPYVSPTVDWIHLDRRIPVRLQFLDPPPPDALFRGADARVVSFY